MLSSESECVSNQFLSDGELSVKLESVGVLMDWCEQTTSYHCWYQEYEVVMRKTVPDWEPATASNDKMVLKEAAG